MRSDVYSLGVILYELVTARLPYETRGVSPLEALRAICDEPPKPPGRVVTSGARETRRRPPRVDPDVDTIVLKALEKDPARWPPSDALKRSRKPRRKFPSS